MKIFLLTALLFVKICIEVNAQINWVSIPGESHLYGVSETNLKWMEAFKFCFNSGGNLIAFDSKDEENNVMDYLKKTYGDKRYFWSSGINIFDLNEWVFMSSGKDAGKVTWCPDEPNNFEESEHCALLKTHLKCWNDGNCDDNYHDQKHYALCKIESSGEKIPISVYIFETVKNLVVSAFKRIGAK